MKFVILIVGLVATQGDGTKFSNMEVGPMPFATLEECSQYFIKERENIQKGVAAGALKRGLTVDHLMAECIDLGKEYRAKESS